MNWKAGHCIIAIMAYGSILAGCSTSDKSVDTGSLTNSCNDFNKKLKRSGEDIYFKDQLIYPDPEVYGTIIDICDRVKTIDTSLKELQKTKNAAEPKVGVDIDSTNNGVKAPNKIKPTTSNFNETPYDWNWLFPALIILFVNLLFNVLAYGFFSKRSGNRGGSIDEEIRRAIDQHIRDVQNNPSKEDTGQSKENNSNGEVPTFGSDDGRTSKIHVEGKESVIEAPDKMNANNCQQSEPIDAKKADDSDTHIHGKSNGDNSKLIDWQWISEIFGRDGIQVGADEFDHIVRKNSIDIYNIYLRNNLLVLDPFVDATAPTEARLLLLRLSLVGSAIVIPSYGFANRFANTTTAVANYGSSDVSTFFEMFEDGTNQLKVGHPAFINFLGNELDVNSIRKGELRGFTR